MEDTVLVLTRSAFTSRHFPISSPSPDQSGAWNLWETRSSASVGTDPSLRAGVSALCGVMASAAPGSRQPYGHGGKAPRGALDIAALITWAIKTATRRGKIAAMRWEHVDRRARVLLIPETKNGTPRRIRSPRRRSRSWMGFPGALTAMCGG